MANKRGGRITEGKQATACWKMGHVGGVVQDDDVSLGETIRGKGVIGEGRVNWMKASVC